MRKWEERSREIANLLNPAFCGMILYKFIKIYSKKEVRLPFELLYLVLPLVVYKDTRTRVGNKNRLIDWIDENSDISLNFHKRAQSLCRITDESLIFLLETNCIKITEDGYVEVGIKKPKNSYEPISKDEDITDCFRKSEKIAKLFINAQNTETIFASLGVRP